MLSAIFSGIPSVICYNGNMQKKSPDTKFDFSAVAKGYGCDAVARMLERNGCMDYLVEIGGEIAVNGHNAKGNKWKVMIDAPVETNEQVLHDKLAVIEVTDCGVATSGNYRNYYLDENGNKTNQVNKAGKERRSLAKVILLGKQYCSLVA